MKKILFLLVVFLISLSYITYAGSFEFKGSTDKVGIREEMGDVLGAIASSDIADLKSGSSTTKEGTTAYTQFIRFKDVDTPLNTSSVYYARNPDTDEDADFLVFNKGSAVTDAFFEWNINFENGLKSKIDGSKLNGLNDAKIPMLSNEYTIIDTFIEGRKIKLTLAKGALLDILREQQKKIYTLGDKSYAIEIISINGAEKKVKFKVEGKETSFLGKGDVENIGTDVYLGVNDIIINSNDPQGSAAKFFIGSNTLTFTDDNYQDDTFSRDVILNKEKISNGFVKIAASLVGDTLKISSIKYRLINQEDMYVKAGDGVKKALSNQLGMLEDWDIRFAGLETKSTSQIKITPSGSNDEYRLELTTSEGKTISVPFVSNKNTFKLGENTKDLVFVEGSSITDFNVDLNDYFVLTSANSKTGKTHILSYASLSNESNTITFNELGGSEISLPFYNASTSSILGEGTLAIGAISAKVYIEAASPNRLSIDMNGDGDVAGDAMDIVTKGGGVINLGATNTPTAPYSITLTTDGSQFEESTSSEVLTFTIQTSQSTRVGLSETVGSLNTVKGIDSHIHGLSGYGVRVNLLSSTDLADSLTIDYPESEIFAKILIDIGTGSKIQTKIEESPETQCTNKKQDGDEIGVDCGGACEPCPSCTDGVKNQDEEGIDCGGACPKICVLEEVKEENACDGCLQTLEAGKKACLTKGTIVGTLYCSESGLLVPLKKNGESCAFEYECKTGHCEEGKCGKKITSGLLIINIGLIILVLVILYYVFTLLK